MFLHLAFGQVGDKNEGKDCKKCPLKQFECIMYIVCKFVFIMNFDTLLTSF